jgi:hypothetical protein
MKSKDQNLFQRLEESGTNDLELSNNNQLDDINYSFNNSNQKDIDLVQAERLDNDDNLSSI